jgi:hypothetical protein
VKSRFRVSRWSIKVNISWDLVFLTGFVKRYYFFRFSNFRSVSFRFSNFPFRSVSFHDLANLFSFRFWVSLVPFRFRKNNVPIFRCRKKKRFTISFRLHSKFFCVSPIKNICAYSVTDFCVITTKFVCGFWKFCVSLCWNFCVVSRNHTKVSDRISTQNFQHKHTKILRVWIFLFHRRFCTSKAGLDLRSEFFSRNLEILSLVLSNLEVLSLGPEYEYHQMKFVIKLSPNNDLCAIS